MSHDPEYPDDAWNLYQHVESSEALNCEGEAQSVAAGVLTPHALRFSAERVLKSDSDGEILLRLWFASPVSVRKIMLIGGRLPFSESSPMPPDVADLATHPRELRAYAGRDDVDFASLDDIQPTQRWDLTPNLTGEGFVPVRQAPFTNISSLTLYIKADGGSEEECVVRYLGLQGEHTHVQRRAVHAKYESQALRSDHPPLSGEELAAQRSHIS